MKIIHLTIETFRITGKSVITSHSLMLPVCESSSEFISVTLGYNVETLHLENCLSLLFSGFQVKPAAEQ